MRWSTFIAVPRCDSELHDDLPCFGSIHCQPVCDPSRAYPNEKTPGMLEHTQCGPTQNESPSTPRYSLHYTDKPGESALILAVETGFIEEVKWYAHTSDAKTLFEAAKTAARSQRHGSVDCLDILLKAMPPLHKCDPSEPRRLIHAVRDGLFARSLNLKKRSLRHGLGIKQLGLDHVPNFSYEEDICAAEALALRKMHLLFSYLRIKSSSKV